MKMVRHFLSAAVIVTLMIWLVTCAVNPVTGKRELMLLSEADELALGQQTDQEVIASYGLYQDPKWETYVTQLGQKMKAITHRPGLAYQFKVLDTPVINAFAVPGGYVYFTRGILTYLNDEAELAGVMGHELGHVNARHTAQQYSRSQLVQLGLGVGMVVSKDFRRYAGLAEFGVGLLFLRFSRDNERQADDLGVEYSSKTGYDAKAMADFFNTLERMSPSANAAGLPEWFSTHPNPVDRIGAVQRKTAEWQQKLAGTPFVRNPEPYWAMIDGMIFGEDPRQGYIDGNTFYQPEMKFSFAIPDGWQLENTRSQVQMVSSKQDAALMLTAAAGSSAQDAAAKFITQSQAIVHQADAVTVNGFSSQRVFADVPTENDTLRCLSYFIQKENLVYTFHGISSRAGHQAYASAFKQTAEQFKSLTDPRRLQVQPKRLSVKMVKNGGTLSTILRASGVVEADLDKMAILNGKKLDEIVGQNVRLKFIGK